MGRILKKSFLQTKAVSSQQSAISNQQSVENFSFQLKKIRG